MKSHKILIMVILVLAFTAQSYAKSQSLSSLQSRYKNDPQSFSKWLKENIEYKEDTKEDEVYQPAELTLKRKTGDCEDFAILTKAVLGKGEILSIDLPRGKHAILLFKHKGIFYMMDNDKLVKLGKKTSYPEIGEKLSPGWKSWAIVAVDGRVVERCDRGGKPAKKRAIRPLTDKELAAIRRKILEEKRKKRIEFMPQKLSKKPIEDIKSVDDIELEGIVYDKDTGSMVIINGKLFKEGDMVKDFRISEINETSAILERNGSEYTLKLKSRPLGANYEETADLNEAMFGIPLGASFDEIWDWCKENKMEASFLSNFHHTSGNAIRDIVYVKNDVKAGYIKYINVNDGRNVWSYFEGDTLPEGLKVKEVNESYAILTDMDSREYKLKVNDEIPYWTDTSQEKLHKNMLLTFPHGVRFEINGRKYVCKDDRFATYITVSPSKDSERLLGYMEDIPGHKTLTIHIYFTKNDRGNLISYAALAYFTTRKGNKLNLIKNALSQKYGRPYLYKNLASVPKDAWIVDPPQDKLEYGLYYLLGSYTPTRDALVWRKNVLLTSGENALIYYEPNIAKEVIAKHMAILEDYRNKQVQKDLNLKEDF